jgi:hypothetical protein
MTEAGVKLNNCAFCNDCRGTHAFCYYCGVLACWNDWMWVYDKLVPAPNYKWQIVCTACGEEFTTEG